MRTDCMFTSRQKSKEKSLDCECPIVADGSLQNEAGRIRYRTLKTTQWSQAVEKAKQWLAWGGTKAPEVEEEALLPEGITIEGAVDKFLACMDEWGWSDGYQRHFRI